MYVKMCTMLDLKEEEEEAREQKKLGEQKNSRGTIETTVLRGNILSSSPGRVRNREGEREREGGV